MRKSTVVLASVLLLYLAGLAQADVFDLGPGITNLETVAVGNVGNAADTRYASPGYGSVSYNYNIGKYEVTAAQYCDFLNHKAKSDPHGLYNTKMADTISWRGCNITRSGSSGSYNYSVVSDWANKPVNYVSYWDACRFANWLDNGQGDGDTEAGAYTLSGDGHPTQRNANWTWAVTSEDEWYKAAYYKSGGLNVGYWEYPVQSDSVSTTVANYLGAQTREVGSYGYPGAYGTFDQGGNVSEWNEGFRNSDPWYRCRRGGSFAYPEKELRAFIFTGTLSIEERDDIGFRVVAVPEPSPIIALLGGLASALGVRRRRA